VTMGPDRDPVGALVVRVTIRTRRARRAAILTDGG
jgi:hypothetical protein